MNDREKSYQQGLKDRGLCGEQYPAQGGGYHHCLRKSGHNGLHNEHEHNPSAFNVATCSVCKDRYK